MQNRCVNRCETNGAETANHKDRNRCVNRCVTYCHIRTHMPPSKKVTIHTCTHIRIHTHTRTYAQQLDKCLGLWRPAEPNALITPHAGHAFPHTSWGRASARRPKCFNKPTSDDPTPTCPCTTTRQMSGAVAACIIKHVMLFVNSGA